MRYLRLYLLACIALAFGFLLFHVREPLRLNVGDPWTDATVLTAIGQPRLLGPAHHASLAEVIYGAVGGLVGTQLALFRLLALAFSGLAAWLLFQWARRTWNDAVAIMATALTTTSLLWMQFADSLHTPPIVHAACFLALWGVVRALETGLRRHYAAAMIGTFVCLAAASTDWVFLPLAVVFTISIKRGAPFARGNWPLLAVCAAGALLALLVRAPFAAEPNDWQTVLDRRVPSTFPTLLRRYAALLSPLLWVTAAWALFRALRGASWTARLEDGTTWMLLGAIAFAVLPHQHPESATLRTQQLLPLYAVGSALLMQSLLAHGRILFRRLAYVVCVLAPLWGLWLTVSFPREHFERGDVARASAYLAQNDGNNFVLTNLLQEGPILAAFGRHGWEAFRQRNPFDAQRRMLDLFETTGTASVHAVIFTTPESRFVDRAISQVSRPPSASIHGWPYLIRSKVAARIAAYDKQVVSILGTLGAKRVLQLANFDIYRIDRASTLDAIGESLPVVRKIEFDSLEAVNHLASGWGKPEHPRKPRVTPSAIVGHQRCRNPLLSSTTPTPNGCNVVATTTGLDVANVGWSSGADVLVRIDRDCDQKLTVSLSAPARVEIAFNGAVVLSCRDPQWNTAMATVLVPRQNVHTGVNFLRLEERDPNWKEARPEVDSITIEPVCDAP